MSSDYKVDVTTIFGNGHKIQENIFLSRILETLKNGIAVRTREWIESDHPRIPEYHHPFKVTKLQFNKENGNLQTLILKQESY